MISDTAVMGILPAYYLPPVAKVKPTRTTLINGKQVPVDKLITVGRDRHSFVRIDVAETTVSRNHAVLYIGVCGNIYIANNDSRNGTFINGIKLAGSNPDGTLNWQLLQPGDKVLLGAWYWLKVTVLTVVS